MSDKNRSTPRRGSATRTGAQPKGFVWPGARDDQQTPNAQVKRARPQHAAPQPPPPEPEASQSKTYLKLAVERKERLRQMALLYWIAIAVLLLVRTLLPDAYAIEPGWWWLMADTLPILLAGLVCVNLSMRAGVIRQEGWVIAGVLLAVGVALYIRLSRVLEGWFISLAQGADLWQLSTVPLLAVFELLRGVMLLVIFLVTWKAAFGMSPVRNLNFKPVYHPLALIVQVIGCLLVAYLSMTCYSQLMSGPVYGLLGMGAPAEAVWYNPETTAWLARLHKPLRFLLYATFVFPGLWAVRSGKRQAPK